MSGNSWRVIRGRTHLRLLYLKLLIIATVIFQSSCSDEKGYDPYPEVEMPIYGTGYSTNKWNNKSKTQKYLFYKVNIKFPANEVISFYENEMRKMNLVKFDDDGFGMRRWEDFNPKSGEWELTKTGAGRFIATWIDKEKKKRIVLSLSYKFDGSNNPGWEKVLLVNYSVTAFFDAREEMKKFNRNQ